MMSDQPEKQSIDVVLDCVLEDDTGRKDLSRRAAMLDLKKTEN